MRYILQEFGEDVQAVIDKVQKLVADGGDDATLLTHEERDKLAALGIEYGTTAHWGGMSYTPASGVIVIYSDYHSEEISGRTILFPGIKVGDGINDLSELPFVGSEVEDVLNKHLEDNRRHVTENDRTFWNNKVSLTIDESNNALVFTRQ